jgi:hypothetical protein
MNIATRPRNRLGLLPCFALMLCLAGASSAWAQNSSGGDDAVTGTVVSSTRNTLVIRDNGGRYWLFVLNRYTSKPASLTSGSSVRVESTETDEAGVRVATDVAPATGTQGSGATRAGSSSDATGEASRVVPAEVRRAESQIEREAKRFRVGIRAGLGLDPELAMVGVQSQIGPFFSDNIYFRPNVDFGFGEVTAMFGLNLEAIYRLPITSRQARWSAYFGAGPGFNLVHQKFESNSGGKRIDFGDFHSDTGLNILGGVRYRSGTFLELKTSVYSDTTPTLRLMVGYNF